MIENEVTKHCCDAMTSHLAGDDVPIVYSPRFREYGLRIMDGGSARQLIDYCPWCGQRLPDSLRDEWFERLARLGFEPQDPGIPDDMETDAWWRAAVDLPASSNRD